MPTFQAGVSLKLEMDFFNSFLFQMISIEKTKNQCMLIKIPGCTEKFTGRPVLFKVAFVLGISNELSGH